MAGFELEDNMTFMTYDEELASIYVVHEVNDYEGWTKAGAISRCIYGAKAFSIMTLSIRSLYLDQGLL
jgi:hypothetical protein